MRILFFSRSRLEVSKKNSMLTKPMMLLLAAALSITALTAVPSVSYADETEDLLNQVSTLRDQIDAAQSDYLTALQESEQYASQLTEAEAALDDIEAQLTEKRNELAELCVSEYRDPVARTIINAFVSSDSLSEVIERIEYGNKLMDQRADAAAEIEELEQEAIATRDEIAEKKASSDTAAAEAEQRKSDFEAQLEAMRPQLEEIRGAYLSTVASKSGNDQLESAIAYLEDVDGLTDIQSRILHAAYTTPYAGSNYCERWVRLVYQNAGISVNQYPTAYADYKANAKSTDIDVAPVGALAFSSGSGVSAAHVGIVVAAGTGNDDALIIDNEGSRTKTAVSVAEWESWMHPNPQTGLTGFYAWGYPSSITLEPITL